MSGFSPAWLALREPADAAARAGAMCNMIARPDDRPLDVVDLGAGTGANLRWLAPRLGGRQRWRLVDDDPTVLAAAADALRAWADRNGLASAETARGLDVGGDAFTCEIELCEADIAPKLDRCMPGAGGLVTASALLDLVSADWLRRLAACCADSEASVLFALTYDGRIRFEPPEPGDEHVRALVNRHQHGDKGFGPALGPDAATKVVEAFAAHGYALRIESTDWRLGPDTLEMQRELLAGWHAAAAEIAPDERPTLDAWLARRLEHVEHGRSRLVVGHIDVAGRKLCQTHFSREKCV
ncbi:MAG TPA: class I SAM-dependent methyltransferase [Gammaproteobacteria bacterium]